MKTLIFLLALIQPTPSTNNAVSWEYYDSDAAEFQVTGFLVCLDGQATSQCANVPLSSGVAIPDAALPMKAYSYKFPPLLAGNHTVSVQACTAQNNNCSSGASLAFILQIVIPNPINLKTVKK